MYSILGIAENGLRTQSLALNAVSANLANVNTPGYGRRQVEFATTPSAMVRPQNVSLGGQVLLPELSLNAGSALSGDVPIFSNNVVATGRPANLAINGSGFFVVQSPGGGISYTRAGDFQLDASRTLVLPNGSRMYPAVTIPRGESFQIAPDGTVTATSATGVTRTVGTVQVAMIPNPQGLIAQGNNLYGLSANSGTPTLVRPGTQGSGPLISGAVNQSATSMVSSLVSLVQASEIYGMNTKVLGVGEAINRSTTHLLV